MVRLSWILSLLVPSYNEINGFIIPTSFARTSAGGGGSVPTRPNINNDDDDDRSSSLSLLPSPITPPNFRRHHHTTTSSSSILTLNGIPKMFRWLTDQYPSINKRLSDGLTSDTKVDNFYLDMNGIIHPCTHGNNDEEIVVLDETAMFKKIFGYVDRLYKIVQPNKLLYLAVDGVAPRAKMNQQRSRRFRSSKEAEQLASTILARDGVLPEGTKFDSNCITPGTDFMLKLGLAMRKWIEYKQSSDEFWKNGADVVFSGPDVPGEGEHKVMDYIRETKSQYDPNSPSTSHPHWEPNLTHVLYGLDADLIMLGLVTHEPNFLLLREKMSVVMAGKGRHKHRKKKDMLEYDMNDFEVLELKILRQLFQVQFRKFADENFFGAEKYDNTRIIDDFVFMCMMVGNDFLPHCPHLEIDNGALSLMLSNYIDLLPEWGGYLTDKEKIHPERFEQFMYNVAFFEEEHFKRRGYEENEPGWQLGSDNELDEEDFYGVYYGGKETPECAKVANHVKKVGTVDSMKEGGKIVDGQAADVNGDVMEPKEEEGAAADQTPLQQQPPPVKKFHKKHPTDSSRSYRDFYYETKLNWSPSKLDRLSFTLRKRRQHVRDYIEGLHWVLNYYHNGCPSWDWYFPHLYGPLATDMVNLHEFYCYDEDEQDEDNIDNNNDDDEGYKTFPFERGTPFPSLAQLLSVLPPQSANLLPQPLGELMIHPSSPLVQYYPQDFTTDPNGKRQPWEAVVQIPFIDGPYLLQTVNGILKADRDAAGDVMMNNKQPLLTNGERKRNVLGVSHTFVPERPEGEVRYALSRERMAGGGGGSRRGRRSRTGAAGGAGWNNNGTPYRRRGGGGGGNNNNPRNGGGGGGNRRRRGGSGGGSSPAASKNPGS